MTKVFKAASSSDSMLIGAMAIAAQRLVTATTIETRLTDLYQATVILKMMTARLTATATDSHPSQLSPPGIDLVISCLIDPHVC